MYGWLVAHVVTQNEDKKSEHKRGSDRRTDKSRSNEPKKPVKRCDWCRKKNNEDELLQCSNCGLYYHFACLELPPISLSKIQEHDASKWKCSNCKDCTLCKASGNEQELLLCDLCDRGFHTFCLNPPLHQAPSGRWVCDDCVFCKSCGSKNPNGEWKKDYTFCR